MTVTGADATLNPDTATTAPLLQFIRGKLRDGRLVGRYAGRAVEAWLTPANPPAERRHHFEIALQTGTRGGDWTYRGGGAWQRPHDHRTAPQLTAESADLQARLAAAGAARLLASLDLYRPELRFDGATGQLQYRQAVPGAARFPPSDTFAQILSVLHAVATANRTAQSRKR